MTFQDMFREEFYEELKDFPASLVIKSIKLMSKARMSTFLIYYKKGSTANLDSNAAKDLINNLKESIKNNFSKQKFSQVFKDYKIDTIKRKFEELTLEAQKSLLKEYTFNEITDEFKSNLTEKDMENNKEYLSLLNKKLKSFNSWYKPFFENFYVSREILLLSIILLDNKDKEYLVMKYDEDLSRTSRREDVSSEVIHYVTKQVFPKIRKNINDINTFIPSNLLETLKSMLNVINTSQIFTNNEMINRVTLLISDYINKINFFELFPNISKAILSDLFGKLSSKEKLILEKEYSFTETSRKTILNDEEKALNKETIKKLKVWLDTYQKYTNFYHLFDGENEIIDYKINELNIEDKKFLSNIYKQGFSNTPNIDLIIYEENIKRLETIIYKIKNNSYDKSKKTTKEKISLNIFDIVKIKDLNKIKVASQELHILEYMKILFGENFDKEVDIPIVSLGKFMTSPFIYSLNSLLENKTVQKQNISIYDYYISYKRENESYKEFQERIDNIVKEINSKKVKTILFNKFYNDVKDLIDANDIDIDITTTNLSSVNAMITKKLAFQNLYYARVKKLDYKEISYDRKTIFLIEYFYAGISLDDIKSELNLCNERVINLFKLKFGENLDELGKAGIFESKDLELMQRVITKINKKLYLKDLLLNIINKFTSTIEYNIFRENYNEKDSLTIMAEKYLGTYLNTQDIKDYLNQYNTKNKQLINGDIK